MGALPTTSFGALLKQYRRARHLTQEALAEQAGLSTNAINSLERGVRQRPYPDTVARLAEALRLSAEERAGLEMAARDQAFTGSASSTTLSTSLADPGRTEPIESEVSAALEEGASPAQDHLSLSRAAPMLTPPGRSGKSVRLTEEPDAANVSRQRVYRVATYWMRGLVLFASSIELSILALVLGFPPVPVPVPLADVVHQHALLALLGGAIFVAASLVALRLKPRSPFRAGITHWEGSFTRRFIVANLIATSSTGLFVVALLAGLIYHPGCLTAHCPTTAGITGIASTHDANIEVYLTAVQSTYFEVSGDPSQYSLNHLPTTIAVQPLDVELHIPYRVVVGIHSLQQGRFGLIIHEVSLSVVQVAPVPARLNVWAQPTRDYNSNLFQIPYTAEAAGAVILSPLETLPDVQLLPGEADDLDIQVSAKMAVDLRFQVEVNYRVTDESAFHTLTLPGVFEVIFASSSSWDLYHLQNGHFVSGP
jgi:transcriptional regulator with XRE-family HTH domain